MSQIVAIFRALGKLFGLEVGRLAESDWAEERREFRRRLEYCETYPVIADFCNKICQERTFANDRGNDHFEFIRATSKTADQAFRIRARGWGMTGAHPNLHGLFRPVRFTALMAEIF